MKTHLFRIIGKVLATIGIILLVLLSYATYSAIVYIGEYGSFPPGFVILPVFWIWDFSLICIGVLILKRYRERELFVAKGGESIHSATPWKKGSEPGLYLTTCGLVVSINYESEATAHVGYKLVPAKRATHKKCIQREGKAILDSVAHSRDGC